MTNRSGGQNFPTTGRPPDRDWMDTKRIRPTWRGNEARNTVDSGIEFTENRHGPLPLQPGGRKRHADDDTLLRAYADIPTNTRNMLWDGPHKRILFESEDPESTLSGSDTQEARPGWPPDDMCADSTRYRGSFDDRDREGLRLLSPMSPCRRMLLYDHALWNVPDLEGSGYNTSEWLHDTSKEHNKHIDKKKKKKNGCMTEALRCYMTIGVLKCVQHTTVSHTHNHNLFRLGSMKLI